MGAEGGPWLCSSTRSVAHFVQGSPGLLCYFTPALITAYSASRLGERR
jgi:hypothetical protein